VILNLDSVKRKVMNYDIIIKIVVAILVVLGGGFVFRFVYKRSNKTVKKTIQKNNIVLGDQAGGDINKKTGRT
jgi:hypothetical protein